MYKFIIVSSLILGGFSCSSNTSSDGSEVMDESTIPTLRVDNPNTFEGSNMTFNLNLSEVSENDVVIQYEVEGRTAEQDVDFQMNSGTQTIPAGERSGTIIVTLIDDEVNEIDENLTLKIKSATNAELTSEEYTGVIRDNDGVQYDEDGNYATGESYFGYNKVWSDEFEGEIDTESYTFEMGDGCPDICGWGNNELQLYTDSQENAFVRDGALVIKAQRTATSSYRSARMITKDKREFKFGRIDVRAKLPEGKVYGLLYGCWDLISTM